MIDTSQIAAICDPIFSKLKRQWEFDGRFGAALLVYAAAEEEVVGGVLGATLAHSWTSKTLSSAPGGMQTLANQVGGLDTGQRFCHSDPDASVVVFATVWPWGGGAKISLRVGCWGADLSSEDLGMAQAKLKSCFGLS
ncbi:MAG: hypothetical protein A2289_09880 [Deltaproteobacteria bacterium RIFOXYA12_FULL_58_15]|nr:MAG: hypothetical protein A2289_09880 [Deltaproteobacteria bacterium RIFOXYA12_FULL_58_15]OGR13512.1 MAG: hypothetical protein A2341_26210 [Deltaproteobacteria bacterium RIFOXYB12_FULL_58_9]